MLTKLYKKKLLLALCVAFGAAGLLSFISAGDSYAQSGTQEEEPYYDPSDYQQWKDNFKETPVEEMAFRKNKKGCAQKMAFMAILIKAYRSGQGAEAFANHPILGEYVQKNYDKIQEKGLAEAQKDMMADYQECIKNSEVEEDPGDEYDLNMRYGACDKLNTILMGTVDGIKKRKNMETIIRQYQKDFPDLSETAYGEVEDPVPLLIGQIYQKAQKSPEGSEEEKYESLYEYTSQLVLGCTM